MGVKNLPAIAARLIAAGRDPARARRRGRARDAARPADGDRDAGGHRRAGGRGRAPAAGDHRVGPVAALREKLAWVERRPLHGRTRRRHAGAGAGQRAGRAAARRSAPRWSRRRRSGSSRARSTGEIADAVGAIGDYALVLPHQPQRRRAAVRRAGRRPAATRAPWPGRPSPRSARAPPRALRARGIARRRGARSGRSPSRWSRRSPTSRSTGRRVLVARAAEARDVLPDALRERGAEVDVVALYDTVAEPLDERPARPAGRRRLRDLHLQLDRALPARRARRADALPAGAPRRLDRPDHERDRARARRSRWHVEAERARHRRPASTALLADACVIVTLLTDYGRDDEFVGVCHGVIAVDRARTRRSSTSRTGSRATTSAAARSCCATRSPTCRPACTWRSSIPQVGTERRAVALRCGDGRLLVGPDNGLLSLAWEAVGGVELAVDITRSPHRLEPVSATFHGRDVFAPVAAHLAAGAPIDGRGRAARPRVASTGSSCPQPRIEGGRASSPTRSPPTASATSRSTSATTTWPGPG